MLQELPRKALVMEVKRNGGAFQPFQREKSVVKASGSVGKATPSAPATSSSAELPTGGSGGNSKREDKDGQGQRKQRRNWSPELHRRFLNALQQLGGSHGMVLQRSNILFLFLFIMPIDLIGLFWNMNFLQSGIFGIEWKRMFIDLRILLVFFLVAATPKQIRELMKVDGLTNDEVKSHLQVCGFVLVICVPIILFLLDLVL